mmetsp:Transcript_15754/g.37251  ORF Transcript_15754/g.37251 Transcript_15754/m.37251 type:complete len:307 (-) Transcript_15754:284-1204(-)
MAMTFGTCKVRRAICSRPRPIESRKMHTSRCFNRASESPRRCSARSPSALWTWAFFWKKTDPSPRWRKDGQAEIFLANASRPKGPRWLPPNSRNVRLGSAGNTVVASREKRSPAHLLRAEYSKPNPMPVRDSHSRVLHVVRASQSSAHSEEPISRRLVGSQAPVRANERRAGTCGNALVSAATTTGRSSSSDKSMRVSPVSRGKISKVVCTILPRLGKSEVPYTSCTRGRWLPGKCTRISTGTRTSQERDIQLIMSTLWGIAALRPTTIVEDSVTARVPQLVARSSQNEDSASLQQRHRTKAGSCV